MYITILLYKNVIKFNKLINVILYKFYLISNLLNELSLASFFCW